MKNNTNIQNIQLSKKIMVNGIDVNCLQMREPKVADQLAADAYSGSDAMKEVMLFANLCDVAPDDIKQLTLQDYHKLQKAFLFFTSE
ncbi:MAG: phage tail assembly protein [Desulfobacteraceae bacterium]|nr:phage tail assembly protein [Desulfobacteraceae bacterium]